MRWMALVAGVAVLMIPASAMAGGGGGCDHTIFEGEPLIVSMMESCFGPEVLEARPGETITFINQDAYGHTVTGAGMAWGSTDILSFGDSTDVTFDDAGVYPYMCILHPGMAGAVVVATDESSQAAAPPPSAEPRGAGNTVMPAAIIAVVASAILIMAIRMANPRLRPHTDL